ncbi:MAG: carboxypeptidase-like regulatory domain-containing protein [Planctomycetaceae bacterium]|jgi:hypothetical protein|nr:carboxypeptidase-like regulatory domain-containing protein [Planctomycetaceae bacterium]
MNKRISIVVVITISLLFFMCGCSNRSTLVGLVPAKGILKFNDKPVDGATILFSPVDQQSKAASSVTDANGKFIMRTLNPNDGVYPGSYKVVVKKTEERGDIEEPVNADELGKKGRIVVKDTRELIEHLPQKYASFSTTDLTIIIPAKGNKEIEFKLTGEVDTTPKKVVDFSHR